MHSNTYSMQQTGDSKRVAYTGNTQQSLHASSKQDLGLNTLQMGNLLTPIDNGNLQYFSTTTHPTTFTSTQTISNPSLNKKTGKLRLSFVTASDQAKFEELFRSAVGDSIVISGEIAKSIMSKSCLTPSVLAKIWEHADTTKSGQLMMPEFVLAMHLCNMAMSGKSVPDKIPDMIYDEVFDVVSSILLSVPDSTPSNGNVNIQNLKTTDLSQHLISGLSTSQNTQSSQTPSTAAITQMSGFQTSFLQPSSNFQPFSSLTSTVPTSVHHTSSHYVSPLPSPLTGIRNYPTNINNTTSQGQWNATNVLPTKFSGIDALQSQLMPQKGKKGEFATLNLNEPFQLTWAITNNEKQVYNNIFRAWDTYNTGFIGGNTAVEIFSQSGLPKKDLELIWTLADSENRGKLNIDEFSIALHLVYRKLNGYEIPLKLPQELILHSSKNFSDSVNQVKLLLRNLNSHEKKSPFSSSITNDTKLSSFNNDPFEAYSKNIFLHKYNSNKTCYIPNSVEKEKSLGNSDSSFFDACSKDEVLNQSDKLTKNKEKKQDTANLQNEKHDSEVKKNKNEIKHLYRQIRHVQEEINNHPDSSLLLLDLNEEHRNLTRELEDLSDELPSIISKIRKVEQEIADAKLKLLKLRDAKNHPKSDTKIENGIETIDQNRKNTKTAAILKARMAILTGDSISSEVNDYERCYAEAIFNINKEKECNENIISGIEESAEQLKNDLKYKLKNFQDNFFSDNYERKKWTEGIDVQNEIKEFIFDLQKIYKSQWKKDLNSFKRDQFKNSSIHEKQSKVNFPETAHHEFAHEQDTLHNSVSINKKKDKVAWIKAEAERRMNERLAAMGIEPYKKSTESDNSVTTVNEKQIDSMKEVEEKKRRDEKREKERERTRLLRIKKDSHTVNFNKSQEFDIYYKSHQNFNNESIPDQQSGILNEKLQKDKEFLTEKTVQEENFKKLKDIEHKNVKKTSETEREKKHNLHTKKEKLRKLKEEMETKKQEEILLRRKKDEMEEEIKRLSLENDSNYKKDKNSQLKANLTQTQNISETNPFLQHNFFEPFTSSNKPNNPFSNMMNQNKSGSSLDTLHTTLSTQPPSSSPIKSISKISHLDRQTDSNTWSMSQSSSDNDSSDNSEIAKKSPAQFASILMETIEAGRKPMYSTKVKSPKHSATESSKLSLPSSYLTPSEDIDSPSSESNRHTLLGQIQKGTKLKKTPVVQSRSSSIIGKV